ncbi:23S rRNA (uracil(1939)-C(5))-methyltransferase RlmD [Thermovenabulum sp.]|uniref:23S rRNA (uracil(1939)-C(5))-methyltransferase RlmD n=1 Tax=Thermovenabulum sp. TaxID=3100335 RepID=UPI003C7DB94A
MSELKVGQTIEAVVENMAHEGQGISRIDGFTVFIEGAIFGERVIAEITKVTKSYAIAKVKEIINFSEYRKEPFCLYAVICGGCDLQHLSYEGQLIFKKRIVEDSLHRIGKVFPQINDTIGMENPLNYRNKAQYPVGNKNNLPVLGFFKKRSHDIVPINYCPIQSHQSNEALLAVKEWLEKYKIPIYDEIKHEGLIRHIVTRHGFRTGEVMVVIVINGEDIPHKKELIEILKKKVKGLSSVYLNVNTRKTNVILGEKNLLIYGSETITEYIGNIKFSLSPLSFFQVNPVQVKVLYDKVAEFADLKGDETVLDVYCGIGTIALYLADRAKKVIGIEVVGDAVRDARENAKTNGIKNAEFIEGEAEKIMPELAKKGIKPDVIVVDPPRKGCEKEVLSAMSKMQPGKIIYVSCNPATLARDLGILKELGYEVKIVQPVDMFPHTHHVECVALMSRVEK